MTDEPVVPLSERLRALVGYLQKLESPGFEFGHWNQPTPSDPGMKMLPYNTPSPVASALIKTAYENGWVLRGFDWGSWKASPEAIQLRDDPLTLERATPEQLAKLLTVLIRQDRFVDGALQNAFETGLLTRILRRVAVLESETTKGLGASDK